MPPPAAPVCVVVPSDTPGVVLPLEVPASLRVVDVMFLIDASASMQDEIGQVRDRVRDLVVPGIRAIFPEAAFGVALFGEFPVEPHAFPGDDTGPYTLRASLTTDPARIESALDATPVWGNRDDPEAAIEGVYQVATGEGLSPWILGSLGCPGGGVGGPCFRTDAFRILMVVTDAPMHEGPPGVEPVAPYDFEGPHDYAATTAAVEAADLFVIGLGATDLGRPTPFEHLAALGRDTGSVDASGRPLVFDIGARGSGVGADIVESVRRVADDVPLDVDAIVEDRAGDPFDARDVVRSVRARSALPASGVTRIEGNTFFGVRPLTRLRFEVSLDAQGLPPSSERREIPARAVFRAFGRTRLEVRDILIVIPGADGAGCASTELP